MVRRVGLDIVHYERFQLGANQLFVCQAFVS